MLRLLRLGSYLVLISSLLWGGACSEPGDTGRDDPDVGCEIGSTEKQGCNICQCTAQAGWQCTARACGDADARVSVVPDGGFDDAGPRYGLEDAVEGRDVDARDAGEAHDARDTTLREADSEDGGDDTGANDGTSRRDSADDTSMEERRDTSEDVRDVSSLDTGDATETFACGPGNKRCRVGEAYCLEEILGVAPPDGGSSSSYSCKSYGSCGPNPDCLCLKDREPIGGNVVGECTKRRPGVFKVKVAYP